MSVPTSTAKANQLQRKKAASDEFAKALETDMSNWTDAMRDAVTEYERKNPSTPRPEGPMPRPGGQQHHGNM